MLDMVTLTGVDEQANPKALMELAEQYPRVEFAALAKSRTGTGDPEYHGKPTIQFLGEMGEAGVRTALHLCGRLARAVATENRIPGEILELCRGFGRVQVNLEEEWFLHERAKRAHQCVTGFADVVPVEHPKVEYLFDPSGGHGVDSLGMWPPPPRGRAVGYAGGIGPDNIEEALDFTSKYPDERLWLDMQRKLRDESNRFDMRKARIVCQAAFG